VLCEVSSEYIYQGYQMLRFLPMPLLYIAYASASDPRDNCLAFEEKLTDLQSMDEEIARLNPVLEKEKMYLEAIKALEYALSSLEKSRERKEGKSIPSEYPKKSVERLENILAQYRVAVDLLWTKATKARNLTRKRPVVVKSAEKTFLRCMESFSLELRSVKAELRMHPTPEQRDAIFKKMRRLRQARIPYLEKVKLLRVKIAGSPSL
jgi:hypothetical protein